MQGHDIYGLKPVVFLTGGFPQYARLLAGERVYLRLLRSRRLDCRRRVLGYQPIAHGILESLVERHVDVVHGARSKTRIELIAATRVAHMGLLMTLFSDIVLSLLAFLAGRGS